MKKPLPGYYAAYRGNWYGPYESYSEAESVLEVKRRTGHWQFRFGGRVNYVAPSPDDAGRVR